jgi:hypothetical protein
MMPRGGIKRSYSTGAVAVATNHTTEASVIARMAGANHASQVALGARSVSFAWVAVLTYAPTVCPNQQPSSAARIGCQEQ